MCREGIAVAIAQPRRPARAEVECKNLLGMEHVALVIDGHTVPRFDVAAPEDRNSPGKETVRRVAEDVGRNADANHVLREHVAAAAVFLDRCVRDRPHVVAEARRVHPRGRLGERFPARQVRRAQHQVQRPRRLDIETGTEHSRGVVGGSQRHLAVDDGARPACDAAAAFAIRRYLARNRNVEGQRRAGIGVRHLPRFRRAVDIVVLNEPRRPHVDSLCAQVFREAMPEQVDAHRQPPIVDRLRLETGFELTVVELVADRFPR